MSQIELLTKVKVTLDGIITNFNSITWRNASGNSDCP